MYRHLAGKMGTTRYIYCLVQVNWFYEVQTLRFDVFGVRLGRDELDLYGWYVQVWCNLIILWFHFMFDFEWSLNVRYDWNAIGMLGLTWFDLIGLSFGLILFLILNVFLKLGMDWNAFWMLGMSLNVILNVFGIKIGICVIFWIRNGMLGHDRNGYYNQTERVWMGFVTKSM